MNDYRAHSAVIGTLIGVVLVIFIWQAVVLASAGRDAMAQARRKEVGTAQAITGVLLEAHPELETELATVLGRKDLELEAYRQQGEDILRKYGFGRDLTLAADPSGLAAAEDWGRRLFVFVCTALAVLLPLAALMHLWQAVRSRRLLDVLEAYLAEDYTFAYSLEPLYGRRRTGRDGQLGDLLKQLGSLIRLKNLRLQEEQASTKALVTDISHQLKTPIASLKTCFSLYLEADDDTEREEFLLRSQQQMDKLEDLTGALVNISRMEIAMITLSPGPTDLQELLVRAVNAVYDRARRKHIGIELEPFDDITLLLDEKWTAEAVINVLDNAVKYSSADTCIRIAVEPRVSYVRVEIADEGIGVPRGERARIFQRFYRGGHDMVRAAEGSGVGLYLSRMILEKQGGSISVKSGAGKGSVFVIQLRKNRTVSKL